MLASLFVNEISTTTCYIYSTIKTRNASNDDNKMQFKQPNWFGIMGIFGYEYHKMMYLKLGKKEGCL